MGRGRFSAIAAILLAATVLTGACGGDGGSITLRSEGTGQEGRAAARVQRASAPFRARGDAPACE